MAMHDALQFIQDVKVNSQTRGELYMGNSPEEIMNIINTLGYKFTPDEFEDSYTSSLVKCPSEQDAAELTEVYNMVCMLLGMELKTL